MSLSFATRVQLLPFSDDEVNEFAATRLGVLISEVPKQVKDIIAAKSQGNPQFAEQLLNTLTETEVVTVQNGKVILKAISVDNVIFSASIEAVITNRIDRLSSIQQVCNCCTSNDARRCFSRLQV